MNSTPTIVAQVNSMKVVGLPDDVRTVSQDKFHQRLQEFPAKCEGNVMRVIATSLDHAYALMASQLREYFAGTMREIKLEARNVAFELQFSDVKDGCFFWGNLSTTQPGSEHTLAGEPYGHYR